MTSRSPVLRPGEYQVHDAHGRLFTTANDKAYALRIAGSLHGHVTIDLFGENVTIEPQEAS